MCTNTHTCTYSIEATHYLTDYLCVQSQGLWELYSDMELNMISVLAGEDQFAVVQAAASEACRIGWYLVQTWNLFRL